MKLFHRPAHTVSPTLHREALGRENRLRFVLIGALIGALATGAGTFAVERVGLSCARVHQRHRLEEIHRFNNERFANTHTTCLGLVQDHRKAFPISERYRCAHFTNMLPIAQRAACNIAMASARFNAQRATCADALRHDPGYVRALTYRWQP
jgi:hypothetical protein